MTRTINIQGHRGARGIRPENSLAGFAAALSVGLTTIEIDVGITADQHVVIMHDRYLNPATVRDASGQWLDGPGPSVWSLTLAQLRQYDIGRMDPDSDYARDFPDQVATDGTRVPTLEELVRLIRHAGNDKIRFNIETKISPQAPDETCDAETFATRIIAEFQRLEITERCTIQSFDWRTLQHTQRLAPQVVTGYLSVQQSWFDTIWADAERPSPWTGRWQYSDHGKSVPNMIKAAGGDLWSPYYGELSAESIGEAHALGLRVIPWTVNRVTDMQRLLDWHIDGMISDYPQRLRDVAQQRGLPLPDPTPVDPAALTHA